MFGFNQAFQNPKVLLIAGRAFGCWKIFLLLAKSQEFIGISSVIILSKSADLISLVMKL